MLLELNVSVTVVHYDSRLADISFLSLCHHFSLQFLSGGCEISLIAAIDYTGSNGDPDMPSSLHYISPTGTTFLFFIHFAFTCTCVSVSSPSGVILVGSFQL